MRIKFGNRIYLCTLATHSENSRIILLTTNNGLYTVLMDSEQIAKDAHISLLVNGYYDFSKCEYSN
jgi:Cys-tRNA synthase (O-phospho-L-seryl-tRNA:Cys-tRNA synthase)